MIESNKSKVVDNALWFNSFLITNSFLAIISSVVSSDEASPLDIPLLEDI